MVSPTEANEAKDGPVETKCGPRKRKTFLGFNGTKSNKHEEQNDDKYGAGGAGENYHNGKRRYGIIVFDDAIFVAVCQKTLDMDVYTCICHISRTIVTVSDNTPKF